MPTEKPEIFSGFLRFTPFSSLFRNLGFSENKKMPIGIFEQGSRSEPFPCLFRGDICDFSSQVSPLFSLFSKKSLLKKYVLKGKEKMASSRSPPNKKNISPTTPDSLKHESRAFFIFTKRIKLLDHENDPVTAMYINGSEGILVEYPDVPGLYYLVWQDESYQYSLYGSFTSVSELMKIAEGIRTE